MRKLQFVFWGIVISILSTFNLCSQQLENKIKLKAKPVNSVVSLVISTVQSEDEIFIDWGTGEGIEKTKIEDGIVKHSYSSNIPKNLIIVLDGSKIKTLKSSNIVGIEYIDSPVLETLDFSSSSFEGSDVNLSNFKVPELSMLGLKNISTFVANVNLKSLILLSSPQFEQEKNIELKSVNLGAAKGLKILKIKSSNLTLKSIDLTNNQELEVLEITAYPRSELREIKGIKSLKKLKSYNLQYNRLDFNNLPAYQEGLTGDHKYNKQEFIIPKDRIGVAKVDLNDLSTVKDGYEKGTYDTEFLWYLKVKKSWGSGFEYKLISNSFYKVENGVTTFKDGAFGPGVKRADIALKLNNQAYPGYADLSSGYSKEVSVSLIDDNGLLSIASSDPLNAEYSKLNFRVFTQRNEGGKWIDDKEVKTGDKILPGTHISILADYSSAYVIDKWTVNGQDVREFGKLFNGYHLNYVMPESGPLNILLYLERAAIVWGIRLNSEKKDYDRDKFGLDIYVKNELDPLVGQINPNGDYAFYKKYYSIRRGDQLTLKAVCPENYEVEKWTVDGKDLEGVESKKVITNRSYVAPKIYVTFKEKNNALKSKVKVDARVDPSEGGDVLLKYYEGSSLIDISEDHLVDKGKTVSVGIKVKPGYEIDKFIVNGTEYTGKRYGSFIISIRLQADKDLDIVIKMVKKAIVTLVSEHSDALLDSRLFLKGVDDRFISIPNGEKVNVGSTIKASVKINPNVEFVRFEINGIEYKGNVEKSGEYLEILYVVSGNTDIKVIVKEKVFKVNYSISSASANWGAIKMFISTDGISYEQTSKLALEINAGTCIKFVATPKEKYSFAGFKLNGVDVQSFPDGADSYFVIDKLSEDISVEASFKIVSKKYVVTQ